MKEKRSAVEREKVGRIIKKKNKYKKEREKKSLRKWKNVK